MGLVGYQGLTGWQGPSGPQFRPRPLEDDVGPIVSPSRSAGKNERRWLDDIEKLRKVAVADPSDKQSLDAYEKRKLSFLELLSFQPRVSKEAWEIVLGSKAFQRDFSEGMRHPAFVISLDLRQSTELMLLAKTDESFAEFITSLCREVGEIIVDNRGIFDKFTGDGVLGYFPTFYSGEDAGFFALKAAQECHACFERQYNGIPGKFVSQLDDVGFGVGVDYGEVTFVRVLDGPTVVGKAVVHACRMSAADAGKTLLNSAAYEELCTRLAGHCTFTKTTLSVKRWNFVAYIARLNGQAYTPKPPSWQSHRGASAGSVSP